MMAQRLPDSFDRAEEESLYGAFLTAPKRARFLALLASPTSAGKIRAELPHFRHLDPRFARRVSPGDQSAESIARILAAKDAPRECYVVSERASIDARRMDLSAALNAIHAVGMATFLSCVPGRLAYFEDEDPGERYVLER